MTELPERIDMPEVIFAGPVSQNQIESGEFEDGDWDTSGETITYAEYATKYLNADTAIPRAEADAMVAAAYSVAAKVIEPEHGWEDCETEFALAQWQSMVVAANAVRALISGDARAAFEQAVREAREEGFTAGREKGFEEGRAMAHQHDKIFDEVATALQVRAAVEAETERCAQIADDALWDDPMDETERVRNKALRSVAAAIRAPQETSE